MDSTMRRSNLKFAVLAALCAIACYLIVAPTAFGANLTSVIATESDSAWTEAGQNVDVVMTFDGDVTYASGQSTMPNFQSLITIAGRAIDGSTSGSSTYVRPVSTPVVSGNTITFTIGAIADSSITTANYNTIFVLGAGSYGNSSWAQKTTLINTGIAYNYRTESQYLDDAGDNAGGTVTYTVTDVPKGRSMNHILFLDGTTPIFSTSNFNYCLTFHAHDFLTDAQSAYASKIVAAASASGVTVASGYSLSCSGDTFTITKTSGSVSGIHAYAYNGSYLLSSGATIGTVGEPEM